MTFAYDAADRFSSVSNSAFSVAAGYDTLSRVHSLTRPSSSSTIGYDNADRLASLAHVFAPTTGNETWTLAFTAGGSSARRPAPTAPGTGRRRAAQRGRDGSQRPKPERHGRRGHLGL